MTDAITILGIAGSLRQNSFNAALLRAAAAAAPAGCTVDIASIRGIPLYDSDVEAATGVPAVVETLKERVAAADGLLLVTPEYNNSIPGVFKNVIDWLSRPPQDIPRVSGAHKVFDASGTLLDEQIRERLRLYMTGFVAFVQRRS